LPRFRNKGFTTSEKYKNNITIREIGIRKIRLYGREYQKQPIGKRARACGKVASPFT